MTPHILTAFDNELDHIQASVLMMAEQVRQQVVDAFDGLGRNDSTLIEKVIQQDKQINQKEVELDEACVQLIARHSPHASDLRLVMTVMQMITDLERVGDEAKKIAKAARPIIESEAQFVPRIELRHVANMALDMLSDAMDAFARRDVSSVLEIMRRDKEVDALFKGIVRQLATFMMEDPRLISRSLDVLFIAKSIERIGDHATNVAEAVTFMVKGRDIRHKTLDEIEQHTQTP
jgi:phosphate transport system protein